MEIGEKDIIKEVIRLYKGVELLSNWTTYYPIQSHLREIEDYLVSLEKEEGKLPCLECTNKSFQAGLYVDLHKFLYEGAPELEVEPFVNLDPYYIDDCFLEEDHSQNEQFENIKDAITYLSDWAYDIIDMYADAIISDIMDKIEILYGKYFGIKEEDISPNDAHSWAKTIYEYDGII